MPTSYVTYELDGKEVKVTNPDKVFFPESGFTKRDLVDYYVSLATEVLTGCRARPTTLYRWPNGVAAPEDAFYQKRVPQARPEWLETTTIRFPSGRSAEMLCIIDTASLAWAINLGCIDINPWPVRHGDVDHPDELRIDLDPTPDVPFSDARAVALVARDVLDEFGLTGFPKTSGKRGIHIYVRIEPRWTFSEVRKAALAFAREVERRSNLATTAWWKEERRGVFVDYNQNARDRTIASAYSVRPVGEATVSCPLTWEEVGEVDPRDHRLDTVPKRVAERGDPAAAIDEHTGVIDSLLELGHRQEAEGLEEAPLPPHFPKGEREPPRVQPSRRRSRPAG